MCYCAIYEGKMPNGDPLHPAVRFYHFAAASEGEAIDTAHWYAHPRATGFILYSVPTLGGYIDKRLGQHDISCMGCGEPRHPDRQCFERCSQCGAIASGLTPDESDPSVGLFGPGPLCMVCDRRAQREDDTDPSEPGLLARLLKQRSDMRKD